MKILGAKKVSDDLLKNLWSNAASEAYEKSKKSLTDATLLVHPSSTAPLSLHCDTSDTAIESVQDNQQDIKCRTTS